MKKMPLKMFVIFLILQTLIVITSLLYHSKITLLNYIDISFYFTSAFILISLLIYTIQSGFYDVAAKGVTKAFSREYRDKNMDEVPPLSELVSINKKPFLTYGLLLGICMLIALVVYYL